MPNLLIAESPISLLPGLAERIGLDEAIVLQQIHYLASSSALSENYKAFKDGEYWVFHTIEAWQSRFFRWWSVPTVKRIFQSLTASGLVISANFDTGKIHKRLWYRVNYPLVKVIEKMPPPDLTMKRNDRIKLIRSFLQDQFDPVLPLIPDQNDPVILDQNDPTYIYKNSSSKEFQFHKKGDPPLPPLLSVQTSLELEECCTESFATLPIYSEIVQPTEKSSCNSIVPVEFDKIERWDKVTDEYLKTWFLAVYQSEKPSNFTEHTKISKDQLKKIKAFCREYSTDAIAKFRDALIWVREQNDGWWRDKQISLSNLMTNGKVAEYADKHATAMKHDLAYRDRVEGKAPSKDLKRIAPDINASQAQYEEAYEAERRKQELIEAYDYRPVLAKLRRF